MGIVEIRKREEQRKRQEEHLELVGMSENERKKLIHDLKYLISVNKGKTKKRYEAQLKQISRQR